MVAIMVVGMAIVTVVGMVAVVTVVGMVAIVAVVGMVAIIMVGGLILRTVLQMPLRQRSDGLIRLLLIFF
jgi:hypothetical protein